MLWTALGRTFGALYSYSAYDVINMECSWKILAAFLLPPLLISVEKFFAEAGCPFQNPFWFVEKPDVLSVFDENGEQVPNKIRVVWGRMENFKCVDYFQVRLGWLKLGSNSGNLQF